METIFKRVQTMKESSEFLIRVSFIELYSMVNTETGELLKEFKITKKSITSLAFSHDEKYLAIVSSRPRVISWEIG
ncbi:hypothetical protein JHK82_016684 [Glycine max]|nr:hypothetical protein JHK82_016684 [Glycine max]